jgi:hypothetical protein
MAKKKTKASSLRSTAQSPAYALVPKVEVAKGSDSRQRDDAGKHKPSLWSPDRIRIERA